MLDARRAAPPLVRPQAAAPPVPSGSADGGSSGPWLSFRIEQPHLIFEPGRSYTLRLDATCGGSSSSSSVTVRAACGRLELPAGAVQPRGGRQLVQTAAVPVVLVPLAGSSETTVVDGYSGIARAVNASTVAPICGTPEADAGSVRACLRNPVLRTAAQDLVLTLSLGGVAQFVGGANVSAAISLTGNATVASAVQRGVGRCCCNCLPLRRVPLHALYALSLRALLHSCAAARRPCCVRAAPLLVQARSSRR